MPTWGSKEPFDGVATDVINALLTAESSSEALKNLYLLMKESSEKKSLPYLCRRAGISSAGYLSDVMNSKRRLHIKYREGIIRALGIKGHPAKFLHAMITIDNEKDEEKLLKMRSNLNSLRKLLSVEYRNIGDNAATFFFALEVFCAFGIFQNQPQVADLMRYFSRHEADEIEVAIGALERMNLVRREPDRLTLVSSQVDFFGEKISQMEYLKLAFSHGVQSLSQWFDMPNLSLFSSTNISVNQKDYESKLDKFREAVELVRSDLEASDADMVVRLNIQIYPLS